MTRILADLPDDDIKWLDRLAEEQGKSRAALLREAVSAFRAGDKDWLEQGFGLWARHGFTEDGIAFQDRMRGEWDRPPPDPANADDAP
ncbi:MAG: CopG family transcriptional regulator [Erythrobacter sp.]|nr:CopG family transcriptional regulator [Erythrobacter sp.]NCQ64479.1 CopG family transcriptional regulator [Alphaproteobacteria bacterium]